MGEAARTLDHTVFCKLFHDRNIIGWNGSCSCDTSRIWDHLDYIRDWESDIRMSGTVFQRHKGRFSKSPHLFALAKLNHTLRLSRVQQEERSKRIGGPPEITNRISPAIFEKMCCARAGHSTIFSTSDMIGLNVHHSLLNDHLVTGPKNMEEDSEECGQRALSDTTTRKRFLDYYTGTLSEHLHGNVGEAFEERPLASGFADSPLCMDWTAFGTSQDSDCSAGDDSGVDSDCTAEEDSDVDSDCTAGEDSDVDSNCTAGEHSFWECWTSDLENLMIRCNHSSTKHDEETCEDDEYCSLFWRYEAPGMHWRYEAPEMHNVDEHWLRRYYSLLRYRRTYILQSFYCQHQAYILRSLFSMLSYFLHPDQYHDFSPLDRIKVIEHIGLILELVCEIYKDRILDADTNRSILDEQVVRIVEILSTCMVHWTIERSELRQLLKDFVVACSAQQISSLSDENDEWRQNFWLELTKEKERMRVQIDRTHQDGQERRTESAAGKITHQEPYDHKEQRQGAIRNDQNGRGVAQCTTLLDSKYEQQARRISLQYVNSEMMSLQRRCTSLNKTSLMSQSCLINAGPSFLLIDYAEPSGQNPFVCSSMRKGLAEAQRSENWKEY